METAKFDSVLTAISRGAEKFIQSDAGQVALKTGAGIMEKRGDREYVKAVFVAEALARLMGATPEIIEVLPSYYKITWKGEQLKNAIAFFREMGREAAQSLKPKKGVVKKGFFVDFVPVLSPLAIVYGGLPILAAGAGVFGIGYLIGKKKK